MKTKRFQLMPMEAIDSYVSGVGKMIVRILSCFTVINQRGKEMDQGELVTILAETMIMPTYALQHYIQWEEIDKFTVRGTIRHKGAHASGVFYLNERFEITKFETFDRYFSAGKGKYELTKWTALASDYRYENGYRSPRLFSAVWNKAEGDYEYFRGQINSIFFHIKPGINTTVFSHRLSPERVKRAQAI